VGRAAREPTGSHRAWNPQRAIEARRNGSPGKSRTGINQQIHADRQANGGKLTSGERQQINTQQNHVSRGIYRGKHN